MNQEVQTIEHHYGGHVVEADTIQGNNQQCFKLNKLPSMISFQI